MEWSQIQRNCGNSVISVTHTFYAIYSIFQHNRVRLYFMQLYSMLKTILRDKTLKIANDNDENLLFSLKANFIINWKIYCI